jgi:hypothetical protein
VKGAGGNVPDLKIVEISSDSAEAHARAMEFLHGTIEIAEREKAIFVMVVLVGADHSVTDGWSDKAIVRPFTVLGALEYMKQKFYDRHLK